MKRRLPVLAIVIVTVSTSSNNSYQHLKDEASYSSFHFIRIISDLVKLTLSSIWLTSAP